MSAAGPPQTVPDMLVRAVGDHGDEPALYVVRDGKYQPVTWNTLARDVRRLAAVLARETAVGDRVAQVSENRYEWIVADLAILWIGAVHVSIHATLSGPQIAHQIAHSGARWVLMSGREQAEMLGGQTDLFSSRRATVYDDWPERSAALPAVELLSAVIGTPSTAELQSVGTHRASADGLAALLYTSGTTGDPKGVMLNHRNLASNAAAVSQIHRLGPDDLGLCLLPLSHIFARTCDLYVWLYQAGRLALAENRETVLDNCQSIHPTTINAVPYFYDKLCRLLHATAATSEPGALRKLLGGRIRFCMSGGAALPDETARGFHRQGVPLLQGYGLSETSPVISANPPDDPGIGTVGTPVPGVEVAIAADGEILTRGPHVMVGYWQDPEATAAVLRDGWLHTGDLGRFDQAGRLIINGRKKELIVTATGKNIAPSHLEALLTTSPLIAQAFVTGDGRNYLAALIVPDGQNLQAEIVARNIPVDAADLMLTLPQVQQLYREQIDDRLGELSRHEQIGRFKLLPRAFSLEQGELTGKLSLRREVVAKHFAESIDGLYD
ncbi:MAG: AMP-dependent synthetase/ligase [Planctomycetia bacterium]|nr:MAG: AMP-dependent synthetase/ligase [Planctomycetia bacterium]